MNANHLWLKPLEKNKSLTRATHKWWTTTAHSSIIHIPSKIAHWNLYKAKLSLFDVFNQWLDQLCTFNRFMFVLYFYAEYIASSSVNHGSNFTLWDPVIFVRNLCFLFLFYFSEHLLKIAQKHHHITFVLIAIFLICTKMLNTYVIVAIKMLMVSAIYCT